MKISGVYIIRNSVNGKVYVGSAANIMSRKSWHEAHLNLNNHHSILLQRSYNKYSMNDFEFIIAEKVENLDNLLNIEQLWINATKCYDPCYGYNIYKIAGSPRGYKHTNEAKLKISKNTKGILKSEETKLKMIEYSKNRSDEHRLNHSKAMKKRIFSETHRKRLLEANQRRKLK